MPTTAAMPLRRPTHENFVRRDESITSPYARVVDRSWLKINQSNFLLYRAQFDDAMDRLQATAKLRPGWDTYEAEPPNAIARDFASKFLKLLALDNLLPARLLPSPEGGIAISFVNAANRAEIYNSGEMVAATYSDEGEATIWEPSGAERDVLDTISKIRVHIAS